MHALDERRAHEDLELGAGFGKEPDIVRAQLDGDLRPSDERVGPVGGVDQRQERTTDPIVVERRDRIEQLMEIGSASFDGRRPIVRCSVRSPGIELGVEQLDEAASDLGVTHDRLFDVLGAERDRRLTQIPLVEPQQSDLATVEPCRQHQTVEAVGFEPAGHEVDEGQLDLGVLFVGDRERGHLHTDVVEVHGGGSAHEHRRMLVERRQSEVLERRDQFGDRGGPIAQEHPEAPLAVDRVDGTTERRGDVVGRRQHRLDVHEVTNSGLGSNPHDVIGGHGRRHDRPHAASLDLAERVDQGVAHPFGPRARSQVDRRHQPARVGQGAGADRHRDASERTLAHQRLEVADLAAVVLRHQHRHEFRQRGGEPRLRHVGEHGGPRTDRFGDVEDSNEATLLQTADRGHELGQLVDAGLEDHVARQGLDHVAHRPAGVALDRTTDPSDDLVGPLADDRNREHALSIRGAPEESDETDLAARTVRTVRTVRTGDSDRDRGHPSRAMHGGDGVGPCDHDRLVAVVCGRVDPLGIEPTPSVLAEEAVGPNAQAVGSPVVDRRAEEHEVLVAEPGEQRIVAHDVSKTVAHRCEVVDDRLHAVDRCAHL